MAYACNWRSEAQTPAEIAMPPLTFLLPEHPSPHYGMSSPATQELPPHMLVQVAPSSRRSAEAIISTDRPSSSIVRIYGTRAIPSPSGFTKRRSQQTRQFRSLLPSPI